LAVGRPAVVHVENTTPLEPSTVEFPEPPLIITGILNLKL
jgi:hypothetical protein